jgi:hypothetical protein
MAGLLAPYIPDSGEWFKSAAQGYALGDTMRNRDLKVEAGGQAAEGNLAGAKSTLYGGGDFEGANQVHQLMRQASDDALKKTERFHATLGNLALAADTPEKWAAAVGAAKNAGLDVSKYGDFSARQMVLAQSGKTIEAINMEAERRKVEADQAIRREAIQARVTKAAMPKPRNLSFNDTEKLAKKGVQLEGVTRYGETFKDEFAGYGRGGESTMWIARNLPILAGPTTESAATWWQDYDRYKNTVRNELFGSALTTAEQTAFESADITPNMKPDIIRANLARQKEATKSALAKTTRALTASGYNPEAIEGAVGVPLADLSNKDQAQLPAEDGAPTSKEIAQVKTKEEYGALKPGTRYIAADDPKQEIRTKQ